jgi:hypothetical protein
MKYALVISSLFIFGFVEQVFAQGRYQTLVDTGLGGQGIGDYLNSIYLVLISLAAMLAVIKIIIAGVKYMLSDNPSNMQSAKGDIKNSLLGLIIILATVMILEFINPNLTRLDVFDAIEKITTPEASPALGTLGSGGGASGSGSTPVASNQPPSANIEPISNATDIDENFITQSGNVVSYDVQSLCDEELAQQPSSKSNAAKIAEYEDCLDPSNNLGADALEDYCKHNGGNFSPAGNNIYNCTLPTFFSGVLKYRKQFESDKQAALSNLTPGSIDYLKVSEEEFNEEVFANYCASMDQGVVKDLERPGAQCNSIGAFLTASCLGDYACVRFD